MGSEAYPDAAYGLASGTVSLGSIEPLAEIPYVIEAWAWELPRGKESEHACPSASTGLSPPGKSVRQGISALSMPSVAGFRT